MMPEGTQGRENAKQRMAGPLHRFPLEREIQSLQAEPAYQQGEQNQKTLIHEGPLRVALFAFHAGNRLPDHRVSGPITVQVLAGRIRFSTEEGRDIEMERGDLLSLAGGITHNVDALEDSAMLLTVVQVGEPAQQPGT